jgi:DNA-binding response OmpR family regulator
MGLSAVSKPVGSDREALLGRVEARSAAWRRLVAALAEGGAAGEGRALEEELRSLGREATTAELPLLAEELSACRAIVQGALVLGRLEEGTRRDLDAALDRLRRYAAEQRLVASPRGRRRAQRGTLRVAAYGSQHVVDGLVAEDWAAEDDAPALRVERITRAPSAKLPDVMVVDLSDDGAEAFALAWLDDPATEAVPLIVVGVFDRAEESAELVARGVARILPKPVAPGVLRRACVEVGGRREAPFEPIGETNVERLGLRLASELQRGLGDAVDGKARSAAFDLAGGAEVLTVLWDAVARIRELVAAKSKGSVRFGPAGPIEALPQACWLDSGRRDKGQRAVGRDEVREGGQGRLDGRRVLVVEDDLSVNWFLAGVLQQAGAEVSSARHGREALEIAFREPPDLVITDVVMPELDGLSLRRALGRDVRLRSTPVIMLSWKDDLLQRMRELGVEADGYLRKQATDREIVQRSLEVLRSRRAVVERIVDEAPVRGRLDGLTACDLLAMVCTLRPDARVTLRDARHTIEIDVRGGRPVVATRTDASGHSDRGPVVIASLLGIGGGRFGVETLEPGAALNEELEGSLEEQLLEPVARVRAAERLLAGASLLRTDRVILDEARVEALLGATPEPARGVLTTLAAGISPRELVVSGRPRASWSSAFSPTPPARARSARCARGARTFSRQPSRARSQCSRATWRRRDCPSRCSRRTWAVRPSKIPRPSPPRARASRATISKVSSSAGCSARHRRPRPRGRAPITTPRSWPRPPSTSTHSANTPPPGRPRPRRRRVWPSSPPVAEPPRPPTARTRSAVGAAIATTNAVVTAKRTAAAIATTTAAVATTTITRRCRGCRACRAPRPGPPGARSPRPNAPITRGPPSSVCSGSPSPSAPATCASASPRLPLRCRSRRPPMPPRSSPRHPMAPPPATPAKAEEDPQPVENQPVELPLTDEEAKKLRKGEGLLEVVVGQNDVVFVDGKKRGSGPVVKVPLAPKDDVYEVRVKMRDEERVNYVMVKAGVRTRLRVAPPWSR